jgi:hypothetical protein
MFRVLAGTTDRERSTRKFHRLTAEDPDMDVSHPSRNLLDASIHPGDATLEIVGERMGQDDAPRDRRAPAMHLEDASTGGRVSGAARLNCGDGGPGHFDTSGKCVGRYSGSPDASGSCFDRSGRSKDGSRRSNAGSPRFQRCVWRIHRWMLWKLGRMLKISHCLCAQPVCIREMPRCVCNNRARIALLPRMLPWPVTPKSLIKLANVRNGRGGTEPAL